MFEEARVKLTMLYLIIIMLISGVFSLVIFQIVTSEIESRFVAIQRRLRTSDEFLVSSLNEAKGAVLLRLVYANGVIFVASGISGYFLAGKTLQPIEQVITKQRRFIGDASHELRTPLTALRASIEVALRDKSLDISQARETLTGSLEEIDSLERLTAGLLMISRYEDEQKAMDEVEISSLMKKVAVQMKPLAKEKRIKMKIESEKVQFFGEREGILSAIVALTDNAIKYTPPRGRVEVRAIKRSGQIKIIVKDNGVGIGKGDIEHVFDRFYRADSSRTHGGFGLGLSLTKSVVERHGGSIMVKSKLGVGSEFVVKIPLHG